MSIMLSEFKRSLHLLLDHKNLDRSIPRLFRPDANADGTVIKATNKSGKIKEYIIMEYPVFQDLIFHRGKFSYEEPTDVIKDDK